MAIDTIPPWLDIKPSDFVRAGSMGAEAGARAAAEYGENIRARDRLSLAYAQLASEERRSSERAAAQMEIAGMKAAMQAQAQDAALALRAEQARSLDAYRYSRLGQFETEEDRRRAQAEALDLYRQQRLGQFGTEEERRREAMLLADQRAAAALQERRTHNIQMEEIGWERALGMLSRGEARIVEHPEAPGVQFLRQPNGNEYRITPMPRPTTVTTTGEGVPERFTGTLTSGDMLRIMGSNAPAFLLPGGVKPSPPKGFLRRAADWLLGETPGATTQPSLPGLSSAPTPAQYEPEPGAAAALTAPTTTATTTPAAAGGEETAIPLPSKKADLIVGQIYATRRGNLRWDGENFVTP